MKGKSPETLLLQWQPPSDSGDPVGCLATTFTFDPGFFEEQCLARFLRLDSLPERERLAYLLERETRLGAVTASVVVDRSYAGVDHAMRWDVLPVHIPGGVQHAKICVLAWTELVRIIVSSANLTDQGYRRNREVAAIFDASPRGVEANVSAQCLEFVSQLLPFTLGFEHANPAVRRASGFIERVAEMLRGWPSPGAKKGGISTAFAATLPAISEDMNRRSSLDAAIEFMRKNGNSPSAVSVASPFFDEGPAANGTDLIAEMSHRMGRGVTRSMTLCVPSLRDGEGEHKLAAPRALYEAARSRFELLSVKALPMRDEDGNLRPWHAKLLHFEQQSYHAVMTGSSNFTRAGMGIGGTMNAEANIVYLISRDAAAVSIGKMLAVWPKTDSVDDPAGAEWIGAYELVGPDDGLLGVGELSTLPLGFVAAVYHAGQVSTLELTFNPSRLPASWALHIGDDYSKCLYEEETYSQSGKPPQVILQWKELYAPGALQVRWEGHAALWPVNVEDPGKLPLPKEFESLTADDILWYLAAARPSHAISQIARKLSLEVIDDGDAAIAPDLDPLRRYKLEATFLHRVRGRARLFASVRDRLSEPVWSEQALLWRLSGPIGAFEVLTRLCGELKAMSHSVDETVLNIADFILMLSEVRYQPKDGYIPEELFDQLFQQFFTDAMTFASESVRKAKVSNEIRSFWNSVAARAGESQHA